MNNEIENSWIDIESACGGSFGAYVSLPPAGFGPGLLVRRGRGPPFKHTVPG